MTTQSDPKDVQTGPGDESGTRRSRTSRTIISIFSGLFTVVILGYLVYRQKDVLLSYKWEFHFIPAIASLLIFIGVQFLVASIWGSIMNHLGKPLPIWKHFRYYIISNFSKRLPGTIWYIAGRAAFYKQDGIDYRITTIASGVEYAVALLGGILTSLLFALQIINKYQTSKWLILVGFAIGIIIIQPAVISKIFRLLKVDPGVFRYHNLLLWIFFYIIAWIITGILFFTIANIVTVISISDLSYIIGIWCLVGSLSSLLILSPSNFGLSEIGLSILLSSIVPSPVAVIIAVVNRLLLIFYEMLMAAFFIWYKPKES